MGFCRPVSRRKLVAAGLLGLLTATIAFGFTPLRPAMAQELDVTPEALASDPDAPVVGDPKGDVTIVAFVDYNCPFCKKSAPALAHLLATDRHVRVVFKDWPILAPTSAYGAKVALAAKYQGKYGLVHDVLMKIPGTGVSKDRMDAALQSSGVDIDLLNKDLDRHFEEIITLIKRTNAQAKTLGLVGTPVYFIGPVKIAAAVDYEKFKQIVAEVRAREGK
jgi:protein-disulfide isomerase